MTGRGCGAATGGSTNTPSRTSLKGVLLGFRPALERALEPLKVPGRVPEKNLPPPDQITGTYSKFHEPRSRGDPHIILEGIPLKFT